jgi:type II secretory pathway pseudopilin PulG
MGTARHDNPARTRRISLKASDGWTMIELLAAMALFMVVLTAAAMVLAPAQRSATDDTEAATAQVEIQSSLQRMVRDLRQGESIVSSSTGPNQMTVLINGTQISYKCDAPDQAPWTTFRACYRLTAAENAALPAPTAAMRVVGHLSNGTVADPVFNYTGTFIDDSPDLTDGEEATEDPAGAPPPAFVSVTVKTPGQGELAKGGRNRTIAFNSGFALRNVRYSLTNGVG